MIKLREQVLIREIAGQYFDLMGMRFYVDKAIAIIKRDKLKAKPTDIKPYAEGTLGLDRARPEHKPQSFFAWIDWQHVDKIEGERLNEPGIIATIRTPDKKVYAIVIDGNHRLAKNYMAGKDKMMMYHLNEKQTKETMNKYD
jgi:hypothetical protein